MRTTLLLAFLVGILSFQAPQQAHACSCAMPGSTQESIDQTDVIFSGTVDDVRASGMQFSVSMTVDEDWKGLETSERGEVTVYTATDSAACGYAFEEGEEYLVYGYRDEETGDVRVGLCSATKLLDQADEDIALLSGEGTWACTMDAKMCPDGSYVGRQGPSCEFEACPGEAQACTKELKICPDGTGVGRTGPNCAFEACPGEKSNCAPYVCANGKTHPRCSEDGYVINYFAAPCHMDGGEVAFSDVPATHANAEAIAYVKSEGIVEGYADDTFKADATINRAEFVKILMGAFEDDGRMCKIAPFTDVDQTAWYATYAHKARCQGIVEGYPDGTFKPTASINFAEAAKILSNAYGLLASTTIPACDGDCPWYRDYVIALETRGAIPTSITSFDQKITRGEMAEMIFRLKTNDTSRESKMFFGGVSVREKTYSDPEGAYSVTYPASWLGATDRSGDHVISMLFQENAYARYAYVLIQTPTVCPQAPSDAGEIIGSVMLDGHAFTTHEMTEGAAGMKYATTMFFSQVRPTACIVINKAIGTPNADPQNDMGAYTPAHAAIRDAERAAVDAAVMNVIEGIVIH